MKLAYAEQYDRVCVILEFGDDVEDVIQEAEHRDAIFFEGPGEKAYVVQFPDRPKELYGENALRGSFPIK